MSAKLKPTLKPCCEMYPKVYGCIDHGGDWVQIECPWCGAFTMGAGTMSRRNDYKMAAKAWNGGMRNR